MSDTASADNPIIFSYEEDQDELELEVSINLQEEIGRGRHGIVYAATYYGCDCVAKEMRHFEEEKEKDKSKDAFLKEMAIIRQLKHPNVIDLLEVCYRKDDRKDAPKLPILIMSKMSITLERFLSKASEKSFLYNKVSIMHNIMCGLHYLHKKGIIHRDLTVKAIFLTEDLCAKIADFGQAKDYTKSTALTRLPGEFSHMPPEAFTENPKYTFKLDIFSFGCVVIQIIINVKPEPIFETHSISTAAGYTKASEVERRRKYIKRIKDLELNELCDIIEKCLQDKHEDRPEAVKLLPLIQKCKQALPKTTEKSKLDLVHQLSEATQPQAGEVRSESEDRTKSKGKFLIEYMPDFIMYIERESIQHCTTCSKHTA